VFVTGSLLNLGKATNEVVPVLHDVVAVLTFISTSGVIYLLTHGRLQTHGKCHSPDARDEPEAGLEAVFSIARQFLPKNFLLVEEP
jgi:hypothetical protein